MKKDEPMRNINPFGLRLQPDLKARLELAAEKNKRSLNAEISARLEDSFSQRSNQVKSLNNKLALTELESIVSEASLTAGMLNLLATIKPETPEDVAHAREAQQMLRERLAAMGDLQQRIKDIAGKIITE